MKSLALTAVLLTFVASTAMAAPMTGKIVAVKNPQVRVVVVGKLADWAKKGTKVSLLGGKGTITGVAADTISISTPKAVTAKLGTTIKFDKVLATATGC